MLHSGGDVKYVVGAGSLEKHTMTSVPSMPKDTEKNGDVLSLILPCFNIKK